MGRLILQTGCRSAPFWAGMVIAALPGVVRGQLTPQSPQVQESVRRAVAYLEKAEDSREGGQALIAMAMLKAGVAADHETVVGTAGRVRRFVNAKQDPTEFRFYEMYSPAMMVLFLLELDPVGYRPEIEKLLQFLWFAQKPCGGWGYPRGDHEKTGDTSMTQYAVLAMWEAQRAGFPVPTSAIERVLVWLLRTQDPGGGFGYQGRVSNDFTPIPQHYVSHSLSTAGLGSVYICAHLFEMFGTNEAETDEKLPAALVKLEQNKPRRRRARRQTSIARQLVFAVLARGNAWMQKHYKIDLKDTTAWQHYYLYALERYWSFREAAEGTRPEHPPWYEDGARYLLSTQQPDGSWKGRDNPGVATAFSIMFLVRAAKKSIGSVERMRGILVGGRGLPEDTDSLTIRGGKVVSTKSLKSLEELLEQIGRSDEESFEAFRQIASVPVEEAQTLVSRHAKRLRQLAKGSSPEARLAAVRALAKRRSFEDVPTLIYALTDPDPAVMREARAALRRISRKFDGFGPPDNPDPAQLKEAVEKWKKWYLAVHPDADFES
ncbi:MAG TPA: hypothetical protein EYP56_21480 [Planctomycetaceae bacterium]|nr:hypothetical protein [Planctomycetaceae bacterium]